VRSAAPIARETGTPRQAATRQAAPRPAGPHQAEPSATEPGATATESSANEPGPAANEPGAPAIEPSATEPGASVSAPGAGPTQRPSRRQSRGAQVAPEVAEAHSPPVKSGSSRGRAPAGEPESGGEGEEPGNARLFDTESPDAGSVPVNDPG
jgi:hypothetical protein